MNTERPYVYGETTIQGRKQVKSQVSVKSVQDANDSIMEIVSRTSSGEPSKIEWTSEIVSILYKASLYLEYDVSGNVNVIKYVIEDI